MNQPSDPRRRVAAVRIARVLLCVAGLVVLLFGAMAFIGEAQSPVSVVALAVSALVGFGFLFVGLVQPPAVVVEFTAEWLEKLE